jgi:hypothetical protein
MKFVHLDTMRQQKPEYCVLRKYPEKMGLKTYKLMDGDEVEPGDMPDDRILMSREESGIQVPDLVGNTCSMLILSRRLKESLEELEVPNLQFLPVKIINHKKRVASADHFIVNPLGSVDILDTKASDIEWLDGEVVAIETMVLDPRKAKKAPDLLRVKEDPAEYLVSERVIEQWRAIKPKPTNVSFTELDFAKGR